MSEKPSYRILLGSESAPGDPSFDPLDISPDQKQKCYHHNQVFAGGIFFRRIVSYLRQCLDLCSRYSCVTFTFNKANNVCILRDENAATSLTPSVFASVSASVKCLLDKRDTSDELPEDELPDISDDALPDLPVDLLPKDELPEKLPDLPFDELPEDELPDISDDALPDLPVDLLPKDELPEKLPDLPFDELPEDELPDISNDALPDLPVDLLPKDELPEKLPDLPFDELPEDELPDISDDVLPDLPVDLLPKDGLPEKLPDLPSDELPEDEIPNFSDDALPDLPVDLLPKDELPDLPNLPIEEFPEDKLPNLPERKNLILPVNKLPEDNLPDLPVQVRPEDEEPEKSDSRTPNFLDELPEISDEEQNEIEKELSSKIILKDLFPHQRNGKVPYVKSCIHKNKVFTYDRLDKTVRDIKDVDSCVMKCKSKPCFSFTYIPVARICFLKKASRLSSKEPENIKADVADQYAARYDCLFPGNKMPLPNIPPKPIHKMLTRFVQEQCFVRDKIYPSGNFFAKDALTLQECWNICSDKNCFAIQYYPLYQLCILKNKSVKKPKISPGFTQLITARKDCLDSDGTIIIDDIEDTIQSIVDPARKAKCLKKNRVYRGGLIGFVKASSMDDCINSCVERNCKALSLYEVTGLYCLMRNNLASSVAVIPSKGGDRITSGLRSCLYPTESETTQQQNIKSLSVQQKDVRPPDFLQNEESDEIIVNTNTVAGACYLQGLSFLGQGYADYHRVCLIQTSLSSLEHLLL